MAIELKMGANKSSTKADDRPQADIWLNVGYTATDGEGEDVFIGLPMGIPLDTMKESPMRGKDEGFRQVLQAKNSLLETVQKAAAELKPGQEEMINLQVQIRRVSKTEEPAAGDNPLLGGLATLGFAQAS